MKTFFSNNHSTILERIARSDKSAVAECVDLYGATIWTLAKQNTNSPSEAEKAVSEIFADIWEKAMLCDLSVSDEAVWIALIANRRLRQYAMKNDLPSATKVKREIFSGGFDSVQNKTAMI